MMTLLNNQQLRAILIAYLAGGDEAPWLTVCATVDHAIVTAIWLDVMGPSLARARQQAFTNLPPNRGTY